MNGVLNICRCFISSLIFLIGDPEKFRGHQRLSEKRNEVPEMLLYEIRTTTKEKKKQKFNKTRKTKEDLMSHCLSSFLGRNNGLVRAGKNVPAEMSFRKPIRRWRRSRKRSR